MPQDRPSINAPIQGIVDADVEPGALRPRGPRRWVPGLVRRTLDILLPPQCLGCGTIVSDVSALCPTCWDEVRFLDDPVCAACGLPFDYDEGAGVVCGACARHRPDFRSARSAMIYDERSRHLVLSFKHGDRTDAAPVYARWMMRAGASLIREADVLVPVPLHWTRLFRRRYNQSALLAHELSRLCGLPVELDVLKRTLRTPSMGKRGPADRRRALNGAFAVKESVRSRVEGQRILLIDDVLTTGTTAGLCAKSLSAAGAESVDVLTLARAVRLAL